MLDPEGRSQYQGDPVPSAGPKACLWREIVDLTSILVFLAGLVLLVWNP